MPPSLTCRCSRCQRPRDAECTRPENGAKFRLASETDSGKRYLFEVAERCECGARTALLELRHGW